MQAEENQELGLFSVLSYGSLNEKGPIDSYVWACSSVEVFGKN